MRESLFFHLHVCVKVDPRCLHRLVTEPQSNYARVHAAAQKGHGGCVPQRMRRHGLAHERRARPTRGHGMSDNESLQGIGTERSTAGAGEDRIDGVAALVRQPGLEDCDNLRAQWRTPHLPPLAETTDMSAGADIHILTSKRGDLAVTQACLDGEKQERPIPSSNPCSDVRRGDKGSTLVLREKLHWSAIITLGGYRQDALAVESECGFIQGDVAEEGMQRAQAVVSCRHSVSAIPFEVFEELTRESRVKVLQSQIGRLPAKALRGETQQQAKRIPVAGHRVRAGAKLAEQPVGEETLKER
jgi:hypothetical protein